MGLNKSNQFVTVLEVSRCLDVQKDIGQVVPSGYTQGFPGNAYTFYRKNISIICFKMETKPRMWKRATKIKTPKPINTNKQKTRQNHKTV